jgi:hypothetical protein
MAVLKEQKNEKETSYHVCAIKKAEICSVQQLLFVNTWRISLLSHTHLGTSWSLNEMLKTWHHVGNLRSQLRLSNSIRLRDHALMNPDSKVRYSNAFFSTCLPPNPTQTNYKI